MSSAVKSVVAGVVCSTVFVFVLCCICNPQYVGECWDQLIANIGGGSTADPLADAVSWQQTLYPMLYMVEPERKEEPFQLSCTLHILPPEISPDNPSPLRRMRFRCANAIFEVSLMLNPDPTALGLFPGPDIGGRLIDEDKYVIYEASLTSSASRVLEAPATAARSRTYRVLSDVTGWSYEIPISISCAAPDENGIVVATYSMEGVEPFSMPLDYCKDCEIISVEATIGQYTTPSAFGAFRDFEVCGKPLDLSAYRGDWDSLELATIGQDSDLFIVACPIGIAPPPLPE